VIPGRGGEAGSQKALRGNSTGVNFCFYSPDQRKLVMRKKGLTCDWLVWTNRVRMKIGTVYSSHRRLQIVFNASDTEVYRV